MIMRSQDNEILINLDRIGAIAKSKGNHIVASESVMPRPSEILDLGQYSTEAKAIKVLDMIEDAYTPSAGEIQAYIDGVIPKNVVENRVFQMPLDEEVEE